MWPAKLEGEDARLWDACRAMCDVMGRLGVAVDGGKDSLSMTTRLGGAGGGAGGGEGELVKAPGGRARR